MPPIEIDYFKHPLDMVNTTEYLVFAEVLESAGIPEWMGYCALMRLNEETRRMEEGVLPVAFYRLVRSMGIEKDKLETILKIGIECGLMIAVGDAVAGVLAMESLSEMQVIHQKRSDAGKKGALAKAGKAEAMLSEAEAKAGIEIEDRDSESESESESESKLKLVNCSVVNSQANTTELTTTPKKWVFYLEDGSTCVRTQNDVENLHRAYPSLSHEDIERVLNLYVSNGPYESEDELNVYISQYVKEEADIDFTPPDKVYEWKKKKDQEEGKQPAKKRGRPKKQTYQPDQPEKPVVLNEQQTEERKQKALATLAGFADSKESA